MRKKPRSRCVNEAQLRAIQRQLAERRQKTVIARNLDVSVDVVDRVEKFGIHYRLTASKHQRCPGCGGLQTMPCRVCGVRIETTSGRLAS